MSCRFKTLVQRMHENIIQITAWTQRRLAELVCILFRVRFSVNSIVRSIHLLMFLPIKLVAGCLAISECLMNVLMADH